MARVLVVYYSHSGHTKAAALDIARLLDADVEEIHASSRSPSGLIGFFRAGKDAWQGRSWPIEPSAVDVAAHDLVVLCAPVWAGRLAPPVRAWLQATRKHIRSLAACATAGGTKAPRFFTDVEELASRPLVARTMVTDPDRNQGEDAEVLRRFARKLKASC